MNKEFRPDFTNILLAAQNKTPKRMPIYEHLISESIMEKILNRKFADLYYGDLEDKREYFRNYIDFFRTMGYDTVSFERCVGAIMPGSGALGNHQPGVIKTRDDFAHYPWAEVPDLYWKAYAADFELLRQEMPSGMKAIGGPGNGIFECVQDVVGYTELCYISADDPGLYNDLYRAVGLTLYRIWEKFLGEFGDIYTVCRFGDDLGFKSSTLLPPDDIRTKIIPQYRKIVELVHSYRKPFLLHSCGHIFEVMEELITVAKIDAKHSNEDQIAPFSVWVEKYGGRIGNFGGVDMDHLCSKSETEIREITMQAIRTGSGNGGFALGSGNSIPDYVPVPGYLAMIETAREARGE